MSPPSNTQYTSPLSITLTRARNMVSGNATLMLLRASLHFPMRSLPGIWNVAHVSCTDEAQRGRHVQNRLFQREVTVINTHSKAIGLGSVTSLSISPNQVNTDSQSAVITIDLAFDLPIPLEACTVEFYGPDNS